MQKIYQESEADVVIASARNPVTHNIEDSKLKEELESSVNLESEVGHDRAPSVAQSEVSKPKESQTEDEPGP